MLHGQTDIADQLRQDLRQAVLSGRVKIGQRLASERNLAARYRVPRSLVGKVLSGLTEEGLIDRQVGRGGTVVVSNRPSRPPTAARQISCLLTHFRNWSATDNYFYDLIHGAQAAAGEAGFSLNLWSPPNGASGEQCLDQVLKLGADVLLVEEEFDDEFVERLCGQFLRPIVLNRPSRLPVDTVLADNPAGIHQAVTYLHHLGHRRIGYVGSPFDPNNKEREDAFVECLAELGLSEAGNVSHIDIDSRHLATAGLAGDDISLLEEHRLPEPFVRDHTALIGSNDYMAKAILNKARGLGLEVPRDLSVVGFGDFALAGQLTPKLTSVRIESRQIGQQAVRLCLDRLKNIANDNPQVERIPVELQVRQSGDRPKE